MKIDEFLEYGDSGTVKVKRYDYTDPDHIIISENDKPVFCIDTYTDTSMPGYSEIVYRKYSDGIKSKGKAKSLVMLKKRIKEKEDGTVIIESWDNDKMIEVKKISEHNGYSANICQRVSPEQCIMRVIGPEFELNKERSEDRRVNEIIRDDGKGNRIISFVQQYEFNGNHTFQYIRVEIKDGKAVKVIQKLHDTNFKLIQSMITVDPDELEALPWTPIDSRELIEEVEGVIVERRYVDKFSPNQQICYFTQEGELISEVNATSDGKILNFRSTYNNTEYFINRYISTSDALYEVSMFRNNDNNDIDMSVSMLVTGNVIDNLVDDILTAQWEYFENKED